MKAADFARVRATAKRLGVIVDERADGVHLMKDGVRVLPDWPRYSAEPAAPGLPRFRMYPEGFVSFMGKALGRVDIEVGVKDFDLNFMVRGDEPELVRSIFTDDMCREIMHRFTGYELVSTGDRLVLHAGGVDYYETDSDVTHDAAIELLFAIGATDVYGRDLLRALPEATYCDGPLPYVQIAGPGDIRVGFARDDDTLVTEARAALLDGKYLIPGTTITRDGPTLVIRWPHVVRDPATLVSAIEYLRSHASGPHDGVFR
jgi:hypothetical protein